jgi:Flp pilus assembly protein TadD
MRNPEHKKPATSQTIVQPAKPLPPACLAACILLLVLAAVLPYLFSLHGEFVLDDHKMIERDETVHSLRSIPSAFTKGFLSGVEEKPFYYRPLVTVSYALNYAICGADAAGFKLVNLLLHAVVTLLVFILARRILSRDLPALMAALIFAVHPAHTEAVAWISARTELLAAVFALASVLAFWRYTGQGSRAWYAASVASFFAALLSKENVLILPVILAALVWIRRPRPQWRRALIELIPFAAAVLVYLVIRRVVLGYTLTQTAGPHLETRLLIASVATLEYLRILFVPGRAEPIYDIFGPAIRNPWIGLAAWVAVIGLFAGAIASFRRWPRAALSALWMLAALLPVINIIPIPNPIPVERFLYLPSVGFSLLVGPAFAWVVSLRPKPLENIWPVAAGCVIAGMLLYCAIQTYSGAPLWSNDIAITTRMVQRVPRFAEIHILAGAARADRGDLEGSMREYQTAVRISPKNPAAHRALSILYRQMGRASEAVREARIFVDLLPNLGAAHNMLGAALAESGDLAGAVRSFERASQLAPDDPAIRFNLAQAYSRNREYGRAVEQYRSGLSLRPSDERARYELGLALRELGRSGEARAELSAVARSGGQYAPRAREALAALKGSR